MKRVYLYVGRHQRLTGEVKRLGKPLAVLRKRGTRGEGGGGGGEEEDEKEKEEKEADEGAMEGGDEGTTGEGRGSGMAEEALEVVEVVQFKILFTSRPEPVGE